ncbi:SGNH/GDSL hydrolase family protein [Enterobacter asburiae]|uniref:SGNH/GDSL hydrolase family protein n=1 Tax=Enterobacter asburiae TaxID=61645 RepID=UPI004068AD2E
MQQSITALKEKTTQNDYASFKNASVHKNGLADGGTIAIECYGDSTMWGSTSLNSTVQNPVNPPAVFQRTMDLLFGTGKASITNKAIRGTALFSMLAGTDGSGSTFEAKMQVTTASVIYCNHAQNDCNSLLRTVSQYKNDLVTFVNIVRKYGKTPILVTPNITIVLDGITETMTKRLPAFVDAMRTVARVMGVDLVDNHYYTFKTTRYVRGYDIVPDGVHPGTDVYAMCGRNLAIPLISARVLKKPGDISSLSNVTYRDNITSGRNFRNADSLFTKQLSWDAVASQTGIYYPFILDNPTDDTVIGIGGFQWGGGGKTIIGYNFFI